MELSNRLLSVVRRSAICIGLALAAWTGASSTQAQCNMPRLRNDMVRFEVLDGACFTDEARARSSAIEAGNECAASGLCSGFTTITCYPSVGATCCCQALGILSIPNCRRQSSGAADRDVCPETGQPKSPIVLDLGEPGLALTSAEHGVAFDHDGDGKPEQTAWTQAASPDVFLALDRNGNGVVDDGTELFGDATELRGGTLAANGYEALAELDAKASGGNDNGYIDPWDARYRDLRLWRDSNHDGTCVPGELSKLSARGVVAIDLAYEASEERDEHGNELALTSHAYVLQRGVPHWRSVVDVYFTTQ